MAGFCLLDGARLDLADQKGRSNLLFFPLLALSQVNSESVEGRFLWELLPYMFQYSDCDLRYICVKNGQK